MQLKPDKYAPKTGVMQLFFYQNYRDFIDVITIYYVI